MIVNKELNASTAAIWGAFLHEGLIIAEGSLDKDRTLIDFWHGGYLELICEASNGLDLIHQELLAQKIHFPSLFGVFEYEVISMFGFHYGQHLINNKGNVPSHEFINNTAKELIHNFINKPLSRITGLAS